MKKVFSIFLLSFLVSGALVAQNGHKIEIEISGMPQTDFVLAFYFNDATYTKTTAKSNSKGLVVFEGEEELSKGVYILVLDSIKQKLFDFVVYEDQFFKLKTSSENVFDHMEVEGDIDNELFFRQMKFNASQALKADPFNKILADSTITNEKEKSAARQKLIDLNEESRKFQNELSVKYPERLMTKIIKGRTPIETPMTDLSQLDSSYQYYYYKQHYWDNIDLTEDALLLLPFTLISDKIDSYFDYVVMQNADTLIAEIDKLAEKTKPNQEMYKFFVWSFASKYYAPEIMGMGLDKVFVHINDTYFESGAMDFWANEQLRKNMKERADQLRLSMMGTIAPELIMQDLNKQAKSLYELKNEYSIIYFYDPDCGHCKVETPKLAQFINETKFDVQVYAVCADTSMAKMEKYIVEMSIENWVNVSGPRSYVGSYQKLYDAFQTPTIYVLDRKKKIIAKKLPAEKLEDFLSRYAAMKK